MILKLVEKHIKELLVFGIYLPRKNRIKVWLQKKTKKNYLEALVTTDKLLTVDKVGRVTIHSTASKKSIDVVKPIIEKKQTKRIIRKKR